VLIFVIIRPSERLGKGIALNSDRGEFLEMSGTTMHAQSLTDEGLVKSVLCGDENAFSQLYERYRRPIYSAAYRIIQNSEDARDATQEIAFKLYKSLHQWDVQKSRLSSWIYKMAANHSIDCYRMRRRRLEWQLPEDSSDWGSHPDTPDRSARSPFNAIKNKEEVDAVLQCAGALPDLQRKIFIHRFFHERKLEEIARIERCNLGTVKSALHRATHTVRRLLRKSVLPPSIVGIEAELPPLT
jgi:RNA polymerase sigma-70 factor (ECF subfamily)